MRGVAVHLRLRVTGFRACYRFCYRSSIDQHLWITASELLKSPTVTAVTAVTGSAHIGPSYGGKEYLLRGFIFFLVRGPLHRRTGNNGNDLSKEKCLSRSELVEALLPVGRKTGNRSGNTGRV